MSLSLLTIMSDIPGSRDLILPGQMGLLAPAQDAKALSEAIRWMPRIPRSGELWGDRDVSLSLVTSVPAAYTGLFARLFRSLASS